MTVEGGQFYNCEISPAVLASTLLPPIAAAGMDCEANEAGGVGLFFALAACCPLYAYIHVHIFPPEACSLFYLLRTPRKVRYSLPSSLPIGAA